MSPVGVVLPPVGTVLAPSLAGIAVVSAPVTMIDAVSVGIQIAVVVPLNGGAMDVTVSMAVEVGIPV